MSLQRSACTAWSVVFFGAALAGGCTRPNPAAAPPGAPVTFAHPEVLEVRVMAHPQLDESVVKLARELQQREADLGRPWSADVRRDTDRPDTVVARWLPAADEFMPASLAANPDLMIRRNRTHSANRLEVLTLVDETGINRADFQTIQAALDSTGAPCVNFTMTPTGAKRLTSLTSRRLPVGGRYTYLAFLVDGTVVSTPKLEEAIGAVGQIAGEFTPDEVRRLVELCNTEQPKKPMPRPTTVGTGFVPPLQPTRPMPRPSSFGTGSFPPTRAVPTPIPPPAISTTTNKRP